MRLSEAAASQSRCPGGISIQRRGSGPIARVGPVLASASEHATASVFIARLVSPAARSALQVAEGARAVWSLPVARRLLVDGLVFGGPIEPVEFSPSFRGPGAETYDRSPTQCTGDGRTLTNSELVRSEDQRAAQQGVAAVGPGGYAPGDRS